MVAQRRMFSKTITNSSQFLMMPLSAQCLYFHFGMNADDDGFCEYFGILRMTGNTADDLKILQAKKFIFVFDDKVLIILNWKENNFIRKDRYQPSRYLEIYKKELVELNESVWSTNGQPMVNQEKAEIPEIGSNSSGQPMVDPGKVRLGLYNNRDEKKPPNVDKVCTGLTPVGKTVDNVRAELEKNGHISKKTKV